VVFTADDNSVPELCGQLDLSDDLRQLALRTIKGPMMNTTTSIETIAVAALALPAGAAPVACVDVGGTKVAVCVADARGLLGRFTVAERLVALQALDAVGLSAQALQRASTLSGGQQQRGAIARALVQGAQLLLADEPVASLDPESTRMVMDLLQSLNQSRGMTLVLSLHNVDLARKYCTRTVALRQGRLVYDGPSSGLDPQRLKQLYGAQHQELTGHEALGQAPELAQPWVAAA
jgi:ABC-type cobalamin/Fe3+-siderophores transport system ATPase subunit